MKSTLINRNVWAPGRTSMRLEREFWDGLDGMSAASGLRRDDVVIGARRKRPDGTLTSAVRVAVLMWFMDRAGEGDIG